MLSDFSESTQLILSILGIAVLCLVVLWNTKRNHRKLYHREQRNFRKNYTKKSAQRKNQESKT